MLDRQLNGCQLVHRNHKTTIYDLPPQFFLEEQLQQMYWFHSKGN